MKLRYLLLFVLVSLAHTGCSGTKPVVQDDANQKAFFTPEPPVNLSCAGLRISVLNTEFMFDGTGDEGSATFDWKGSIPQAREHRDKIGKIIKMLNSDIIVLEEVENENVLRMLINESLQGMGYAPVFVQGKDTFTGQDMGILTRVQFDETGRIDGQAKVGNTNEQYGVSKNIWARFKIGSLPVTIVGIHFLSQASSTERADKRNAQAEVIRQFVEQESLAGRAVIVTGDFNDYDDIEPDIAGSVPVTKVMETIKKADANNPNDNLINVIKEVPQARRFTGTWDKNRNERIEEGEFTAIDHMLFSPQLYRFIKEVNYVHSHDPFDATDHFPISVCLNN